MKTKNAYGLGWIFKATKGVRLSLLLFTVLILGATVGEMSMAYFLKQFVDIATGELDTSLLSVGLLAIAVVCISGICILLSSISSKNIYGRTERKLRTELMGVIFSRRMAGISTQHTGELLTKLTVDVQAVSECFPNIISNMIGAAVSALLATAAIFFLNWKIALIMLVLTPLLMLVMGALTPMIQKASLKDKKNDEANRSLMQESLSRIMLIKAYFMQTRTIKKARETYAKKLRSGMKLGFLEGLATFSGMLVGMSMFLVVLGVGAYFVTQGETTFGSLVAIIQLLNYVVNPVAKLAGTISQVSQAIASSGRIGSVIDLQADKEITAVPSIDAQTLAAENLSFSYSTENAAGNGEKAEGNGGKVNNGETINGETINGETNNGGIVSRDANNDEVKEVLEDVNAMFFRGSVTGLVGKSGSGKSTFLKLLIGLYTPSQGRVALYHKAGVLEGEEIMTQVAYVPPDDYLFSGSVMENIVMSETKPDAERMKKAAADANIYDYIMSLPQGFDTVIGEGGGTVSSGQAQRIAIARAIYKDSPIIVFDEPTANLDADSIEKFQSVVKSISEDRICIVVTHDVSTMSFCEKVYVLEDSHLYEKNCEEEHYEAKSNDEELVISAVSRFKSPVVI